MCVLSLFLSLLFRSSFEAFAAASTNANPVVDGGTGQMQMKEEEKKKEAIESATSTIDADHLFSV